MGGGLHEPSRIYCRDSEASVRRAFRRSNRNRSLWQFMAWSFIVAETLSAAAWISGGARAVSDDDSSSNILPSKAPAKRLEFRSLDAVATGDGDSDVAGPANQAIGIGLEIGLGRSISSSARHQTHRHGTSFVHA